VSSALASSDFRTQVARPATAVLLFHTGAVSVLLCRLLMSGSSCSGLCNGKLAVDQQPMLALVVALLKGSKSRG
jgi:hypothetical protein